MKLRLVALAAILPVATLAAEPPAATPPPPGAVGISAVDGTVQAFTLATDGTVCGVLLGDGTEIQVPRRLATALQGAVKAGDEVHVQGWRTPTPGVVDATALTDARTGHAVVASQGAPPAPPLATRSESAPRPPGLPPPGAQEATLQGRVMRPLHAPDGALDGALLGDGTDLRLPPDAARRVANLLQPGNEIAVEGYAMQTPYGQVMAVQAIGGSPDTLTQIAPGPAMPAASAATPPAPARPPPQ
jgi:hypothetical protein